jgi:cytochrome b
MHEIKVWDPLVRIFHWSTVAIVFINTALFDEGKIHEALGYALVAMLTIRVAWGFVGTRYARFANFFPTRARLKAHLSHTRAGDTDSAPRSDTLGHNPLGALMILNLMATLGALGLSGHLMTTDMFWSSEMMEEVHEVLVVWLLVSVVLHVAGVLTESFRSGVNLISVMVSGTRKLD